VNEKVIVIAQRVVENASKRKHWATPPNSSWPTGSRQRRSKSYP